MNDAEKPQYKLNFVLFGKAGSGKSASGNTILGRRVFTSKKSSISVTQNVQIEHCTFSGFPITVYDTPGFCNTKLTDDQVIQKCQNVFSSCESESSICTYLLVIKADRFTEEEQRCVQKVESLLGEERMKDTWILFTGEDELKEQNQTIDDFIRETESLSNLVCRYDNRYHVFNNKIKAGDGPQRTDLLNKVSTKEIKSAAPNLRRRHPSSSSTTTPTMIQSSSSDRRIVLLGKTGSGKSATGNTILGNRSQFISKFSLSSVTHKTEVGQAHVEGRNVTVIDTPGLFDISADPAKIAEEILKSICAASPGPHAFLIVLPLGRFTDQEKHIIEKIETMFGEEVRKYTILLFTHGDELNGENVEEHMKGNKYLSNLVQNCGGGYHVLNNKDLRDRQQVSELLQKIDRMVENSGGVYYTNQMFLDAWENIKRFLKKYWKHIFACLVIGGAIIGVGVGGVVIGGAAAVVGGVVIGGAVVGTGTVRAAAAAISNHLASKNPYERLEDE